MRRGECFRGYAAPAAFLLVLLAPCLLPASPAIAEDESGIQFAPDDEPSPQPPPAPPAPPAPAAKDEATQGQSSRTRQIRTEAAPGSEPEVRLRVHARDQGVFGRYRVRVMGAYPRFDDGLKYYDRLYGSPKWYPQLAADWFAFDWYATLGLSFRMGYYQAQGHAGQGMNGEAKDQVNTANLATDKNDATTLTLLPLQACVTAEMTPFQRKWVVLDGWIGVERLYYQEVRQGAGTSAIHLVGLDGTGQTGTGSTTQPDDTLTNAGWKNSSVLGFAANILLNPLDETSTASLRGPMGIGSVYLSPFTEIVRTVSKTGVSFGRTVTGVAFTFETAD
jgi:hypothetical protein